MQAKVDGPSFHGVLLLGITQGALNIVQDMLNMKMKMKNTYKTKKLKTKKKGRAREKVTSYRRYPNK